MVQRYPDMGQGLKSEIKAVINIHAKNIFTTMKKQRMDVISIHNKISGAIDE